MKTPQVAAMAGMTPLGLKPAVTQFQVGKTYSQRSICDHDCVFSFKIIARTAKTVTTEVHGKTVKRGLRIHDGVETFKPFGTYSMCTTIYANKLAD